MTDPCESTRDIVVRYVALCADVSTTTLAGCPRWWRPIRRRRWLRFWARHMASLLVFGETVLRLGSADALREAIEGVIEAVGPPPWDPEDPYSDTAAWASWYLRVLDGIDDLIGPLPA